jgi:hypothetical protein
MSWSRRILAVVGSFVVVAGAANPVGAGGAGAGDKVAVAEEAIAELTASLPGLSPVQGGGQTAAVPECDGAKEADALAAGADEVLQAYGGQSGGGVGRIVVFAAKKDAKRFFKLVTNDDAAACIVATNEAGLAPLTGGAPASADLARGKLRGVKRSATLEGTITIGPLSILDTHVAVQRGKVVIVGGTGESDGAGAGLGGIITEWVKTTAERF